MPSRFIVIYKEGTPTDVIDRHAHELERTGNKIVNRYDSVLLGFSVEVHDDERFTSTYATNEHIDYIEPDSEVTIQ